MKLPNKKVLKLVAIIAIPILSIITLGMIMLSAPSFHVDKSVYIYIDENKDYNKLTNDLEHTAKIKNKWLFDALAHFRRYPSTMKMGRYQITNSTSILSLMRNLQNGKQTPVKLVFNNIRTKKDLAERISSQMMLANTDLFAALNDSMVCQRYGFNKETIVAMFIPNTYSIFWDSSVDKVLDRMDTEYKKFWNEERLSKAKSIGLSPIEVSTLASIVEEECLYKDEYPMVAGLYMNRLRIHQPLQADPTVKFAVGDFSLRRILNKHLSVASPYNTYLHIGLPPGPIRIPSIKGIDAVLNYTQHNFLYMCAKEDFSGRHNFAAAYSEHLKNADKYRKALDKRNIY